MGKALAKPMLNLTKIRGEKKEALSSFSFWLGIGKEERGWVWVWRPII